MSAREEILARVKQALERPAARPGSHHRGSSNLGVPSQHADEWLPLVGERKEQQIALFEENAAALKANFEVLPDIATLYGRLSRLAQEEAWQKVASHKDPLLDRLSFVGLEKLIVDEGYQTSMLERCDVGITRCEALIAQTGSVLVTATTSGGRALSVLPPHHVVIATMAELVPDLPQAMQLLSERYPDRMPSFTSFITGPSRTGDIERILVLGAHGPKKMSIYLLADAAP